MTQPMVTLPGLEIEPDSPGSAPTYGQGPTEREIRASIAEIEQHAPMTGVKRTVKQLAISLAISIDRGNTKGRAVANESAQLFAMMQQLDPVDETAVADDAHLTPETRRLLDALAAPAQLDPAAPLDTEGLQPADARPEAGGDRG